MGVLRNLTLFVHMKVNRRNSREWVLTVVFGAPQFARR